MRGPFTTKTITIMAESSSPWEARKRAFDGWRRCLRLAGDMIRVPRSDRNATWLAHFFIVPADACLLSEIWCAVYASTQMTRTNAQSPGLAMPRPAWRRLGSAQAGPRRAARPPAGHLDSPKLASTLVEEPHAEEDPDGFLTAASPDRGKRASARSRRCRHGLLYIMYIIGTVRSRCKNSRCPVSRNMSNLSHHVGRRVVVTAIMLSALCDSLRNHAGGRSQSTLPRRAVSRSAAAAASAAPSRDTYAFVRGNVRSDV